MARKYVTLTLTEDMLSLISNIRFQEMPDLEDPMEKKTTFSVDLYNLYGGSFLFEDIALILGRYDERMEDSENGYMGAQFSQETTDYFLELHSYITENLDKIEELIHQFVVKGGIKATTYRKDAQYGIWEEVTE